MAPDLQRGDLVLVRSGHEPGVGDVVLYRDPAMGVRVLHRVIRVESGRLVLQGDANDFVDDARPRPGDVIGSYWFSIPHGGSVLLWLEQPLHAALLAFVLTILTLAGSPSRGREKREEAQAQ
jgi:signal peptidase I